MALYFDVEIELLVCPRDASALMRVLNSMGWDPQVDCPPHPRLQNSEARNRNRHALRSAIAGLLTAADIPSSSTETGDYESWTILDEPSLDEVSQYWRIELVSRVLSTEIPSTSISWQAELDIVFRVLQTNCQLLLTKGCSMHVHVSPQDSKFTAEQLRGICKGSCFFDDAITRVMPADRKENEWAVSNVVGRGAGVSQKLRRSYSLVPAQTWARLFKLLDKVTPGTVHGLLASNTRYLSWNFEHITEPCGTVEFRRPPGVDSVEKASHWAAFALGFVAQAMDSETDWARLESRNTVGSVEELRAFVTQGIGMLGPTCSGALGPVREDSSPPDVLTQEELDQIELKKQRKGMAGSPFAEKANSRPNTPASSKTNTPTLKSAEVAVVYA